MQRSIMSFFYPTKESKAKKPEKETNQSSGRETEPPPKVALKERNGVVPDSDSPVKRSGRKAARVLSSEGEEEDEALSPTEDQKPGPDSPRGSPPNSATCPKNSPSFSDTSPMDISPSGIPKRLTARKQLPKRVIQDVLEDQNEDEDRGAKKRKEEKEAETPRESPTETGVATAKEEEEGDQPSTPPEPSKPPKAEAPAKTESVSIPKVSQKQEPQEKNQSKAAPRGPKTFSSFFTPRKPSVKTDVKEEQSSTPGKEEAKGLLDPVRYNPAKNNYHPIEDACWRQGQK